MNESIQEPPKQVASLLFTQNVHLATFMATAGCEPQQVLRGPERTQLGHPIVKFVYDNSGGVAEEIFAMWSNPKTDARGWGDLSREEKEILINFITAHANNLRHFLAEVKKDE